MDHLQGEDGGGERGAEEGGEGGRHAADGEDAAPLRGEAQNMADLAGDRGPQLKGSPLPAGGAPNQVGEDGGEEDQGGGAQVHGLVLPDGYQHQVGPLVLLHAADLIEEDDGQPAQGEQADEPGVELPQVGGQVNAIVEGHAHRPHQQADAHSKGSLPKKGQQVRKERRGGGRGGGVGLGHGRSPHICRREGPSGGGSDAHYSIAFQI